MRSKFGFLPLFVAFLLTSMPFFLIYMGIKSPAAGVLIPILFLAVVIYFWLTEFRTRAHRVMLEKDQLVLNSFFGLGKTKSYKYDGFDGFITSQQPGRWGPKEYIFLMKGDKRVVCISEFYHRNYPALRNKIEQELKFLGEKEYKFGYEYRQMFR